MLISCLVIAACSSKVTPTADSGKSVPEKSKYSEDLSVLRPKIQNTDTVKTTTASAEGSNKPAKYVEPRYTVNSTLDAVLDTISSKNKANGFVDGFTIQVYSGIKREEALNVKKQLSASLPGLNSEVQYVQPNFRVRAGKYYDRIEAQKDFIAIKRFFPNAIVLPERIEIK